MNQTTKLNPSLRGPFRSAWSVVRRITGIPLLVFMAGLTFFILMREPNVSDAAQDQAAQHLAQLQQLKQPKSGWIERLGKGRSN
jgi:hypothetical protein